MKNSHRTENLNSAVLMQVFERGKQSASAIAQSIGVSRPTVAKSADKLMSNGVLCADKKGRYFICGSYRIVILKQSTQGAELISINCADKSVERVSLKSVLSMSESDNEVRFLGVAERYIDDLLNKKYTVLPIVMTDSVNLCLPKAFAAALSRKECVKSYLLHIAEKRSVLYLSVNSAEANFYFNCELVTSTKRKGRPDAKDIGGAFDMIAPDLLAMDASYSLECGEEEDIRALCKSFAVEFTGNGEGELSFDELGAVCTLFREYCEKI